MLVPACGQVITSIAGTDWLFPGDGAKAINAPIGGSLGLDVAAAPDGSFYIADVDDNMILRVGTDGIVHVAAGNGFVGHTGDGGLAVNAALFNPQGVAVDSQGNLYIAEYGGLNTGGAIRTVTTDGHIFTIAGTGVAGFAGDGGPATAAVLNRPGSIAIDASGNVYFTDQLNLRIRKFTPGGNISTIAGGGTKRGASGDGGKATDAQLGVLTRLAVDPAGNVFFVDDTLTVRKVTTAGIISTVAGGGQSTADGVAATQANMLPVGVALDTAGNIYVADFLTSSIRKITNGIISTLAGGIQGFSGDGGPALKAALNFPVGAVSVDASGNVFLADNENLRVREISGGIIQTVAGNGLYRLAGNNGPALNATIYFAEGIRSDAAGNIYFSETPLNRVRKIAPDGTISILAGSGTLGYSGDNGPATSARLALPTFLAADGAGNLYISDSANDVIRKIDSNHTITTVAGTGTPGYSGDKGPATSAKLDEPMGIDFDGEGDLWIADSLNHAIRAITPQGVIVTAAGTGKPGYSGDGGPAASAQLNSPQGIRIFAPGTAQEAIYFSDTGNNRVRRIRPSNGQFVIDTVAGNGMAAYSGDGGQAVNASLNNPEGLEFNSNGTLFIADRNNFVVRAVTTSGVISTIIGNGIYNFSGDGGPINQASLEGPFDLTFGPGGFLLTDLYTNRIREVLNTAPSVQANPKSLAFTAPAGSSAVQQTISVSGSIPNFVIGAIPAAGSGSWLNVTPIAANAPAEIQVTADPSGLAAGQYTGTIDILAPSENPPLLAIPITFTVTQPGAPSVTVAPTAFRFQFVAGAPAKSQTLSISNAGGGTLNLSAKTATNVGSWLSSSASTASVGPFGAARLQIQANPTGLAPGTYSGTITIASTNPPQSVLVPVTMIVTAVPQAILIPQTGLTFFSVEGGGQPLPQTFNIINAGQGQMSWSTTVSTVTGGNWLIAFPNSGTSDASSSSVPPQVRVTVFPGTLSAGIYFGTVKVTSSSANNSPQFVSVVLNVLAAGSKVGPIVQPAGMVFVAKSGGDSPGSQPLQVQSLSTAPLTFTSGTSTSSGGNWLTVLPPAGTVTAVSPATIVVQALVNGLSPGVYQGTVTMSFSDGTVRTITIVFVVTSGNPGGQEQIPHITAGTCPSLLKVVFTQLAGGTNVSIGFPSQVTVKVVDDCGAPLVAGNVAVNFSNGDPPLALTSLNTGDWAGTWTPGFPTSQAVVTATATDPVHQLTGKAQVTVGFQQFTQPPAIMPGGVVNGASFAAQAPLAPGTLVSVFGSKLSQSTSSASTLPLPFDLGGASLVVAGVQAPLVFSSDGQVNAMIPYGIQVDAGQQVVLARGNTLSVAQGLTISAASPGVFTTDGNGKGQGHVYVAHTDGTQALADAAHPAAAGDVVVIYCTGLGEVTPAVSSGSPAPFDHLTFAKNPVNVNIGGITTPAQFAGLTPGFAGLYQVNVAIPSGVAPGTAVTLSLSEAGQFSSPVTIAVK